MSNVILNAAPDITVTAAAGLQNSAPVCVLALQGFESGVTINGGAAVNDIYGTNCSVQANSNAADALTTNGVNALIQADSVCANYGAPPTGNDIPNAIPPAYSCPPIWDPFGRQLAPEWDGTAGGCPDDVADDPETVDNVIHLDEGCYVDVKLTLNRDIVFKEGGVFYFYDTDVKMTGNKDATGLNITIFLYGTSTIDLGGTRDLTLTAKPLTDHDYTNILIAADASNSGDFVGGQSGDTKIGGDSSATIRGIIHLPKQDLRIGGNAPFVATDAALVGNRVTVVGSGGLTITGTNLTAPVRRVVMLMN